MWCYPKGSSGLYGKEWLWCVWNLEPSLESNSYVTSEKWLKDWKDPTEEN